MIIDPVGAWLSHFMFSQSFGIGFAIFTFALLAAMAVEISQRPYTGDEE